ncbi:hypothetical protein EBT25_13535 [bacterium]|nr:hypothetical protein [bacterium]
MYLNIFIVVVISLCALVNGFQHNIWVWKKYFEHKQTSNIISKYLILDPHILPKNIDIGTKAIFMEVKNVIDQTHTQHTRAVLSFGTTCEYRTQN